MRRTRSSRKVRRATLAFGVVTLVASPALGLTAGASGPGPTTMVPVATGINPAAIPGATAFGTTPADTPETVSFVLDARNANQLSQSVQRGVHSFLSVSQFAQTYGQSAYNVNRLRAYLASFGITTQVYPDMIDVTASGTAGQFDAALAVRQSEFHVPGFAGSHGQESVPAQTVHANDAAPELPNQLAKFVLAILGLTNYGPFTSQAVHAATTSLKPQSLDPSTCLAIAGIPSGCNLPSDFVTNYGLGHLQSHGAIGSGQTIGIVTLAALDVGAPEYFWSNVMGLPSTGRTVSVENIDGGPGAPSWNAGSSETDLDVEQSGGVAPGANVVVYQAPNTDVGFLDAFAQAASENVAGSVSASWGESETLIQASVAAGVETPAYQSAFDEVFAEMAAQGQSGFASSGDSGAYGASADLGTTNLSVISPSNSPFITSAGGTTRPWSATFSGPSANATITVSQERAWGWDYLWQPISSILGVSEASLAPSLVVGSGGGFSATEPMPAYQQDVSGTGNFHGVPYLTPTAYQNIFGLSLPTGWNFNASPSVVSGRGSGRAVPDLSADADPETGYLEYSPVFADQPGGGALLEGGWGGTSFVAPQMNGAAAVINSFLGHRAGFWNPSIYEFATSHHSPFTPLQQVGPNNDNIFYTGNPGALYNEATGLGIPDLTSLAYDFAGADH